MRLGAPRGALLGWLGLLALCGAGAFALFRLFPGRVSSGEDWSEVAWGIGALLIVSAGLLARRPSLRQTLRHALLWAGVVSVLLLGVAFAPEFTDLGRRLRSALVPAYAVQTGPREFALTRSADGAYYVVGKVNGTAVPFLVDTGASDIVLSPADARRLGLDPAALAYGGHYETANGVGRAATYTASTLEVGPIRLANVRMSINEAPMRTSLLGLSFFKRLESMRFEGDRLVLRAKP